MVKLDRCVNLYLILDHGCFCKSKHPLRTKWHPLPASGVLDPGYVVATRDSAAIARLSALVIGLSTVFEDTITMVRQQPYEDQEKILTGYRKLMEEQVNMINSRIQFVKRAC